MMLDQTVISPDIPVNYEHQEHKYYLGDRRYLSATQVVDRFVNHFDTPERASYMAYRYGGTPEEWVAIWNTIRDTSLVRGTAIHDRLEKEELHRKFLYETRIPPIDGMVHMVHEGRYQRTRAIRLLTPGVHPELMIWRHDCRIAGRIDKPTIQWVGNQKFLHIEDYKTGRFIFRESYQDNITKQHVMMREPLAHLMDCGWFHYCLQLSLYQYMGEYHGFLPGVRRIIHYPHEIEGLGTPRPVEHEVPYLREEVLAMINHLNLAA